MASAALAEIAQGRDVHLVLGMLANKDASGLLAPFAPLARSLTAIPVPGHAHHAPAELADTARSLGIAATDTAADPESALRAIAAGFASGDDAPLILVLGSLYLAGEVLRANDELPG